MPGKPLNESPEQPSENHPKSADDDASASILVFISAQAIGSLGFAMSIFAIWFGWLLPASAAASTAEEQQIRKPRLPTRHNRRPPHIFLPPPPFRRASEPLHITPILTGRPEDLSATPRHVSFDDSSISPITRRNTMPEAKQYATYLERHASVDTATPPLSSSPLVTITDLPAQDGPEGIPADSDSSPHSSKPSSLKSSSRLHKLKLFGNNKACSSHRPEPLDKPSDHDSIASTETTGSEKSARRASGGGFVAAWTLSRNRAALPDVNAGESSTPSRLSFARRMSPSRPIPSSAAPTTTAMNASDVLSPTFLTRRSQKRVSAPIPRTSPYGAPYFATPPMLLDNNYHAYLKTLPQFEDEMKTAPPQTIDGHEPERGRGRTPSIRRVNLNALLPKQRSASVDVTTRRDTIS